MERAGLCESPCKGLFGLPYICMLRLGKGRGLLESSSESELVGTPIAVASDGNNQSNSSVTLLKTSNNHHHLGRLVPSAD